MIEKKKQLYKEANSMLTISKLMIAKNKHHC